MLILLSVCPAKSVHLIICECEQRFCVHYLIKRFGGYRNKLYICKQEQKRNEYAKEYKKEKQNGHLSCDAPCEHSVNTESPVHMNITIQQRRL